MFCQTVDLTKQEKMCRKSVKKKHGRRSNDKENVYVSVRLYKLQKVRTGVFLEPVEKKYMWVSIKTGVSLIQRPNFMPTVLDI